MYTNVTHTKMKYKLHTTCKRAQSVGPLGLFFYSRAKATAAFAKVASAAAAAAVEKEFAKATAAAALAASLWVDRANESRASGSSW